MGLFDKLVKKEVKEFSEYEAMVLAGLSLLICDIEKSEVYSKVMEEAPEFELEEKSLSMYSVIFGVTKPLEFLSFLKLALQNESIYSQLDFNKTIMNNEDPFKFIETLGLEKRFKKLIDIVSNEDTDEVIEIVVESITDNELRKTLLTHLVDLAMADGGLSSSEEELLKEYVDAFEIEMEVVEKIIEVISYKSVFLKV